MILQSLVLSAIVQALLLPATIKWVLPVRLTWQHHPWVIGIWAASAVIVLPIILGVAGARLYDLAFASTRWRSTGARRWLDRVLDLQSRRLFGTLCSTMTGFRRVDS